MTSLRHLATVLAVLCAATAADAQQRETAVPASSAGSARQAPTPILTGSGPNGATLRCRDGSYPAPMAPTSACDGKGGVLVRFPVKATPQQAATAAPPAARSAARSNPLPAPPESFVPWRARAAQVNAQNAAQRPPAGATLRCNDGTWIVSDTTQARCANAGGVQMRLPHRP